MNALSDAAQAVEEARDRILARLGMAVGGYDRTRDEQLVDALVAAVRHHDAEVVRADTGHIRYGSAEEYAIRHAALIEPTSPMNRTDTEETP